jgi:subtilisin family serine protease
MTVNLSVSWDDSKKKRGAAALVVGLLFLVFLPAPRASSAHGAPETLASVIVESLPGAADDARHAVANLGGRVERGLGIIDGFVASLPAGNIASLRATPGVHAVTTDGSVQLRGTYDEHDGGSDQDWSDDRGRTYGAPDDRGSMSRASSAIGAPSLWERGITGQGIDVALIDSGVVPVNGLTATGKIVNGPDLSFESQDRDLRYLDTFGHGTHMAGIIAGRDDTVTRDGGRRNPDTFLGVAPDARIVNVKVADAEGATDVSQVIAAIDWVVQHRHDNGLDIRVLNLSFGTDGHQDDQLDPLVHAVDVAWGAGIVVVVAAGNRGASSDGLDNPARDPRVISVGAEDMNGTAPVRDDNVPAWSSSGDGSRNPDVVAPGRSIVSLRDAGSYIDQAHPGARVGTRFFRGSGTSASTAMVSGAAALLLQQRPELTPDQLKELLTSTARKVPKERSDRQGAGLINVRDAARTETPDATDASPNEPASNSAPGSGSLEAARGSAHVTHDGDTLTGEQDIFGTAWDGARWAQDSSAQTSWSGGSWNGNPWAGDGWSADSWSGPAWSSAEWSSNSWSGNSWSGNSWSGNSWSGNSWSGNSWSSNSWSGNSWSFRGDDR